MSTSKSKISDTELTQTPGDASQYEGSNVSTGSQTPESVTTPIITPDSLDTESADKNEKAKDTDDPSGNA